MSDLIVDTCQIMTPLHRETVRMAIDKFSSSNQTLRNWLDICAKMLKNLIKNNKDKAASSGVDAIISSTPKNTNVRGAASYKSVS